MPKKPTKQLGAQDERDALKAKLRRDLEAWQKGTDDFTVVDYIRSLQAWTSERTSRFNKRPGGLQGRKPKSK